MVDFFEHFIYDLTNHSEHDASAAVIDEDVVVKSGLRSRISNTDYVPVEELSQKLEPLPSPRARHQTALLKKLSSVRGMNMKDIAAGGRISLFTPRKKNSDSSPAKPTIKKTIPRPPCYNVCAKCGNSYPATLKDNLFAAALGLGPKQTIADAGPTTAKPQKKFKRATHFIALRFDEPEIVERAATIQKQVISANSELACAATGIDKFHLTLLVLALEPGEVVDAIETLRVAAQQFCEARRNHIFSSHGLTSEETSEFSSMLHAKHLVKYVPRCMTPQAHAALETELLPLDVNLSTVGTFGLNVMFAAPDKRVASLLTNFHEFLAVCFSKVELAMVGAGSHLNGAFSGELSNDAQEAIQRRRQALAVVRESIGVDVNKGAAASTAYYLPIKDAEVPSLRLCKKCHEQTVTGEEDASPRSRVADDDVDILNDLTESVVTPRPGSNADSSPPKTSKQKKRRKRKIRERRREQEHKKALNAATELERLRRRLVATGESPDIIEDILEKQREESRLSSNGSTSSLDEEEKRSYIEARSPSERMEDAEYDLYKRYNTATASLFQPHATLFKTSVAVRKVKGLVKKAEMKKRQLRPRWYHSIIQQHSLSSGAITQQVADLLELGVYRRLPEDLPGRLIASNFEGVTGTPVNSVPLLKQHGDGMSLHFGNQRTLCIELLEMAATDADGYYRRCVSVPLCTSPPEDPIARYVLEQVCSTAER